MDSNFDNTGNDGCKLTPSTEKGKTVEFI